MIPSRRNFDLYPALCWAASDDNQGPALARILGELVLSPGEQSAKQARRHLRRLFEDYAREAKS